MTKDKGKKPIAGGETPDVPPAPEAEDTEGHSLGLLLGMNAMNRARSADAQSRSKKVPEEELPPLSKQWPSMRDHKKA
ncbi:MAG: hypothetical protein M3P84_08315 [Chloroflexota bacterium]|nr:hypothetical protein [Chloroflexota bacterium]